jgi:hypothetical protein
MSDQKPDLGRRRLLGRLALAMGGTVALPFAARAATLPGGGDGLRVSDLARRRKAHLPEGGTYDYETQEMKGYKLHVAGSTTRSDEDAGGSTTFWDGERQ